MAGDKCEQLKKDAEMLSQIASRLSSYLSSEREGEEEDDEEDRAPEPSKAAYNADRAARTEALAASIKKQMGKK